MIGLLGAGSFLVRRALPFGGPQTVSAGWSLEFSRGGDPFELVGYGGRLKPLRDRARGRRIGSPVVDPTVPALDQVDRATDVVFG
jgi:hypothetical protein